MIENLHRTLYEIIQEREARMAHLRTVIQHFENYSGQAFDEKEKARRLEIYKDILILDFPIEPKYHSIKTFRDAIDCWIECSNNKKKKRDRTSFKSLLQKKGIFNREDLNQVLEPTLFDKEEDSLVGTNSLYILTLRADREIRALKISEHSKATYLGYISQIEKMMTDYFTGAGKLLWLPYLESIASKRNTKENRSDLKHREIAKFLEFVEQRARNSTSIRPYQALLLCQALIHAPLPAKKLLSVHAPKDTELFLESNKHRFPVSASFIKFWKSFGETEHLFPESLRTCRNPESRINITITRLSKRANSRVTLTPKILCSIKKIYSL